MQISQQRQERVHLQRIAQRAMAGEPLVGREEAALLGLWRTARHHPTNSRIEEGQGVRLITSGWAGWLRFTGDGRRLIFLFLMPGDFIVPGLFSVRDCDLVSLTPLRTVDAAVLMDDQGSSCPRSFEAIQCSGLRYRHLMLDHMARLMIGSTTGSICLLLCELHERSVRSGACVERRFSFPIGQRMLAAALGRSAVQVNKVISRLQADGLIRVGYDWIEMIDAQALRALSRMDVRRHPAPFPLATVGANDIPGRAPEMDEIRLQVRSISR